MPTGSLPSLPSVLLKAVATLGRDPVGALPTAGLAASYEISGVATAHIAKYREIIDGMEVHLPLAYFYLPIQRAQVSLMLDRRFPYAIPGLIHTANEMRFHRMPLLGTRLEVHVSVTALHAGGKWPRIAFNADLTQFGGKVVSCVSEYQTRKAGRNQVASTQGRAGQPVTYPLTTWGISASNVRRYALVSGDYNPIHLSSRLARIFGFRSAIAHGMYLVGRSEASIARKTGQQVTAMTARFARPIYLPSRVDLHVEAGIDDGAYVVSSERDHATHVCGRWLLG